MLKTWKYFPFIIIFVIISIIFRNWFSLSLITAGDFPNYTRISYERISLIPYAWGIGVSTLGGFISPLSWNHFVNSIPIFIGKTFNLDWIFIQRIFYLFPLLIALYLIPSYTFKKFFPSSNFYFLATLIFSLNTYSLMILGGGQIFLGLAYALFPLSFYFFVKSFSDNTFKNSLIASLIFSILIMLDLRIAYMAIFGFSIFLTFNFYLKREYIKRIIYSFIIPCCFSFLLNAYWIIPTVLTKNVSGSFGQEYLSSKIIPFFSFAGFSNSLSLLHPNWPDNIFGKVSFMRPEFIFIPIIAFLSLLFSKERKILFFAFLGVTGAFLAKGTNGPFGSLYPWMFDHIPGFVMFRDPTKWYSLTALSYSMLIPFTISQIYEFLKSFEKFKVKSRYLNIQNIFILLPITYLLFLIRPAIFGDLGGTFKESRVPSDYIKLEKFLSSDRKFSRTFWLPTSQTFAFYSNTHPILSSDRLFRTNDPQKIVKNLDKNGTKELLRELSVRYLIIPYDSEGEIFLLDRKYSEKIYRKTLDNVQKIVWLKEVKGFGKIGVFEVSSPKDHFWSPSISLGVSYQMINPTKYKVQIKNAKKGDILVFSEGFDQNWDAYGSEFMIHSYNFAKRLNSFKLPKDGNYDLKVFYEPQKYVYDGLKLSSVALLLALAFLVIARRKEYNTSP